MTTPFASPDTSPHLVFDISGLVRRATSQRPTGIERVMLEVAADLLLTGDPGHAFCSYDDDAMRFVEVPRDEVQRLADEMRGTDGTHATGTCAGERAERAEQPPRRPMGTRLTGLTSRAPRTAPHLIRAASHARRAVREVGAAASGLGRDVSRRARPSGPTSCFSRTWSAATTYCSIDIAFSSHDLTLLGERRRERGFRVALMVHDLIPWVTPQYFSWNLDRLLADAIEVADVVVVNSDATHADLAGFAAGHDLAMPTVVKLPMGSALTELHPTPIDLPDGTPITPGSYVLCVGTITIRKNHQLLLDVWEHLATTHPHDQIPHLIIAGTKGWLSDETYSRLTRTPQLRGLVHHLAHATDEQIAWLYRHCAFTAYPSLYEGWGLPVTESHDFHKLCLTTNRSSLPEAANGLAPLLDPHDRQLWTQQIWHYWTHPTARTDHEHHLAAHHQPTTQHHTTTTITQLAHHP